MEDPALKALQNYYIAKGIFTEFEEKNPEKKAKILAVRDQLESLARSLNDLEMASAVFAAVGTQCCVEFYKEEARKSRGY